MRPVGISKLFGFAVAIAALIGTSALEAAPVQNKAVVRGISGTANYSTDRGANWRKLVVGTQLGQNSVIRTAPGARVDLFLGDNGPVVRVTEDTTLGLDKLTSENMGGGEKIIETQLDLRSGRILGHVKKLAAASKYEVKTPTGVAGIRGTQYDIRADGTVTVIEGQVLVVYVVGGQTSSVMVNAGQTATPPTTPGGQVIVANTPATVVSDIRRQLGEASQYEDEDILVIVTPVDPILPQAGDPVDSIETTIVVQ